MQNTITEKKKSVFDQFTGKYSLSKTLRFELVPVGNTKQMLEEERVFQKDKIIQEKYQQTKPYFDRLHREFIIESLYGKKLLNLEGYFDSLKKLQKNKKDKDVQKKFKDISQELRKQINNHFNTSHLFGEEVFVLLKEKYGSEDDSFLKDKEGNFILNENGQKISIFDSWKGFTGYFTKFQETRKNFYKDDGAPTAIATRIVDQNLKRFCENIQLFENINSKINFKEVENAFSINLENVFSLDFYNNCLLQDGIDKYNNILGGVVKEDGEKIKGVNEFINKHRQDNKNEKLPFFKMLDKQILSEKEKFVIGIEDDAHLFEVLKDFYKSAEEKTELTKELFIDFIQNNDTYDLELIYLSKEAINTILQKWMSDEGRREFEENLYNVTKNYKIINYNKKDNTYEFPDFISISNIKEGLNKNLTHAIWKDRYFINEFDKSNQGFLVDGEIPWTQFLKIFEHEFLSLFSKKTTQTINGEDKINLTGYDYFKEDFKKIINKSENDFSINSEEKIIIKEFADSVLSIYQMAKYFAIEKKRKWLDAEYDTDSNFYEHVDYGFRNKFYVDAYERIVKARMLLQSYLTKKPYNTNKWKLNFENPTLADGWDKNKEADNTAVILRKNNRYYLAVMEKNSNKLFDVRNKVEFSKDLEIECYEKMTYKLFPDPAKMFPKVCFSKKGISFFNPSEEILQIYKKDQFKKGDNFSLLSMHKLIDFYKVALTTYEGWKEYSFQSIKETREYKDNIGEFFNDVEKDGYKISFEKISSKYINDQNSLGNLFLFEIHNKDWNLKDGAIKMGQKNAHTLYFESLFSKENAVQRFPIKLNGQAEIFYRPKTDKDKLGYKKDENGNFKLYKDGSKIFNGKRYSADKVLFHVPITLNRTARDTYRFNKEINNFLVDKPDINIVGIDRGEKHLIYYAGIDQKGNILKDKDGKDVLGSLNEINGVNYYKLLEKRAKNRERARQDWQDIENIKDLKKGYISLVVRKLADLIIEHNAILVFEDLNMRFKQIRGGIEKSVYQQLEKALIDKLNFLVNKGEKSPEQAGHLLRAYQLTAPFTSFKEMGKQTGVIFYTQASYTSKTCPSCGFRPNVKWDDGEIKDKLLKGLVNINYNKDHFTIEYKLSDFIKNQEKSKRGNILYSNKDRKNEFVISTSDSVRYKWFNRSIKENELNNGEEKLKEQTEKGVTIEYNITECLKGLFEKNGINFKNNLSQELNKIDLPDKFYNKVSYYLHLLTNTRSAVSGTEVDYINCPSCGFHSNKGFNGCEFNGDANGAYNIARKGIIILDKINNYKNQNKTLEKMGWGDLFIDIEEWDKFTQK